MAIVRKAVIPAAGKGTRFLPATKAIPKEMIPIVDVPMIQLIVEEAVRSGIEEVVLVTSIHKDAIENHFDYNVELESFLEEKGKKELAEVSRSIGRMCNILSVRQKTQLGLGHAVLCAASVVGPEPFAVLLGDDLIDSQVPCIGQLLEVFKHRQASVVAVMRVSSTEVSKYGIAGGEWVEPKLMRVNQLVEKPDPQEAPSQFAIPGRYVLMPEVFELLRRTRPGRGGEIQLTDALQTLASQSKVFALQFEGIRYDSGDRLGWLDATLAYALKRPELEAGVRELMQKHLKASVQ